MHRTSRVGAGRRAAWTTERRSLIVLLTAVGLALGLLSPPAFAQDRLEAGVSSRTLNGPLTVHTYADRQVAAVRVDLRVGDQAPYTTVDAFRPVGTKSSDTWPVIQQWVSTAPVRQMLNSRPVVSVTYADGDTAEPTQVRAMLQAATRLEDVGVTPTTVNAGDARATVRGRLVYLDADGRPQPAPGARVKVDHHDIDDHVTTGPDGHFEKTYYVHYTGSLQVMFRAGTAGPYASAGNHPVLSVTMKGTAPTRMFAEASPEGTVFPDDVVTVTGQADWKNASGEWLPVVGRRVRVRCGSSVQTVTTAPDGTYRADLTILDRCKISATLVTHAEHDGFEWVSTMAAPTPDVHLRTRFQELSPWPAAVARGDRLVVSGHLVAAAPRWGRGVSDAKVRLEFSRDGRNWEAVSEEVPDSATGLFTLSAPARHTGRWRIRAAALPYYYTSPGTVSSGVVTAKDKTRFIRFDASPEPVVKGRTLTVQGTLQRRAQDGVWRSLGNRQVTVYFQAKGTATWQAMGTATTDGRGRLSKRFKAVRDGSWRVTFTGGPLIMPVRSSADFVDVR
ncbi:MAG TPA: hypothetical protein VHJ17_24555 [Thermomonospora sp.]|nr:hypothetical protein [Thermomonospora sp.]